MARTIRLQGDSNAHDRPWRVAVEQGFFAEEGLDVVYHEDNPKGAEGRVKDFAHRWKETQLQHGALEVYPVCEWGAIERVQRLGKGKIIGLDATVRTGAIMVRKDSRVHTLTELRNVPIAVTWHAGTFYAAIEAMEAAGVPFWRGGIVAGEDVDEETAGKLRRALNRAIEWLRQNEDRSRAELLRDLKPELRKDGLLPELTGVKPYQSAEFKAKVDWMLERGFLHEAPSYEETVRTK